MSKAFAVVGSIISPSDRVVRLSMAQNEGGYCCSCDDGLPLQVKMKTSFLGDADRGDFAHRCLGHK